MSIEHTLASWPEWGDHTRCMGTHSSSAASALVIVLSLMRTHSRCSPLTVLVTPLACVQAYVRGQAAVFMDSPLGRFILGRASGASGAAAPTGAAPAPAAADAAGPSAPAPGAGASGGAGPGQGDREDERFAQLLRDVAATLRSES